MVAERGEQDLAARATAAVGARLVCEAGEPRLERVGHAAVRKRRRWVVGRDGEAGCERRAIIAARPHCAVCTPLSVALPSAIN